MPKIITAQIDRIAVNPFRRLHDYPYVQSKLDALDRSIEQVGLWPSIMARPLGDRNYEIAFGHHRIEAARRRGLKEVSLIVQQLSDKEMLQLMGRENLEDYNAYFLIQLESWEAALKSGLASPFANGERPDAIDIAKLLGWTAYHSADGHAQLNATARACHAAYAIIEGGYIAREIFTDLTVAAARDIAERTYSRMQQIEVAGKTTYTHRQIENDKLKVGKGASKTADQVRSGVVNNRDVRSRVDFNTMAQVGSRPSPLFVVFANAVAENIRRTINTDSDSEKLASIEKALEQISMIEDAAALRRLKVELVNLSERAQGWDKRLIPSKEKVVQLRALEDGRASK